MNWTIFFAVLGAVALIGGAVWAVAWATDKFGLWVLLGFVAMLFVGVAALLGMVIQ